MAALPPFGFTGRVQFTKDCFRRYAVGLGEWMSPPDGIAAECLAQVRYVAAANRARNQAIVGESRIAAALERCDRSVILLHNHHFPIAWTLDQDHTFFHTQHQQCELQLTHGKVSLDLTPKSDIHAESVRSD